MLSIDRARVPQHAYPGIGAARSPGASTPDRDRLHLPAMNSART
ncbi:hypothetical protein [Burkholderia aenigmatica]|nr:hypothetical protein [Burkholderia aenigmatica]